MASMFRAVYGDSSAESIEDSEIRAPNALTDENFASTESILRANIQTPMASIVRRTPHKDSSAESVEDSENETSSTSANENRPSTESIPRGGLPTPMALTRITSPHPQLPNLQPHQHSTLFYLSLIEGRCRTQAASVLHLPEQHPDVHSLAQHLFSEMTKTLHKAGILPDEFAGHKLSELRTTYLSSFDSILQNIAANRAREFQNNNHSYSSLFERSQDYAIDGNLLSTSSNNPSLNLNQLALQPYAMAPALNDTVARFRALSIPDAPYKTKYDQKCLLGSGGYGKVYKAVHRLDQRAYAIKKIKLKAKKQKNPEAKAAEMLSELQVLAQLDHRNIVRYHYSWMERRLPNLPQDSDSSESEEETDASTPHLNDVNSLKPGPSRGDMHLRKHLARESRHSLQISRIFPEAEDNIVFADSDSVKPAGKDKSLDEHEKSFFHGSGSPDETDDEDNDASKSRANNRSASDSNKGAKGVPRSKKMVQSSGICDVILYIQMSLHPLSLEDFLWPEKQKSDELIKHCYHSLPTARLLLAILEGIEYIHDSKVVHRDLKPANIMLSVSHEATSMRYGSINVCDCPECAEGKRQSIYITPHICDFGLVAKIQDPEITETFRGLEATGSSTNATTFTIPPTTSTGNSSGAKDSVTFRSSREDKLAVVPVRKSPSIQIPQVGTFFYMAPKPLKGKAKICPKVDVYSLGVIALEMICEFGTVYERGQELVKLKNGGFPQALDGHPMEDGIKHMLAHQTEERWSCEEVRKWLEGIIERPK